MQVGRFIEHVAYSASLHISTNVDVKTLLYGTYSIRGSTIWRMPASVSCCCRLISFIVYKFDGHRNFFHSNSWPRERERGGGQEYSRDIGSVGLHWGRRTRVVSVTYIQPGVRQLTHWFVCTQTVCCVLHERHLCGRSTAGGQEDRQRLKWKQKTGSEIQIP